MKFSQAFSIIECAETSVRANELFDAYASDEEAAGRAAGELYAKAAEALRQLAASKSLDSPTVQEMIGFLMGKGIGMIPPYLRGFLGSFDVPEHLAAFVGGLHGR